MIPILLTGFGRWEDLTYNPSGVVARALDGETVSGAAFGTPLRGMVDSHVLDVAWESGTTANGEVVEGAALALAREVAVVKPIVLLSIGVLPRMAHGYDVEIGASNWGAGNDVRGKGPTSPYYRSKDTKTLISPFPAKQIITALEAKNLGAYSKPGLGGFLCERVAYEGARLARLRGTTIQRAGFIHIPNPMTRIERPHSTSVTALDGDERKRLEEVEREIIGAIRTALEVILGSLPLDAQSKPRPWKYDEEWRPELEIELMR